MTLKQIVEALIFASQKPLAPKEIVAVLRGAAGNEEDLVAVAFATTKDAEIVQILEELREDYTKLDRAFQLVEQVNGWQIVTKAETGRWVRQLYPESKPTRLSGPALETLAIIAYRQPIMKADIEAVRGVAVDGVVQSLLERNLLKIHGRAEVPGRPLLYATSEYFLEHFGLKSLDELPNSSELRRISLPSAPKKEEESTAAPIAPEPEPEPEPKPPDSQSPPPEEAAPDVEEALTSPKPAPTQENAPTPEDTKPAPPSETDHVAE
jgi:segregation and condensation protein B